MSAWEGSAMQREAEERQNEHDRSRKVEERPSDRDTSPDLEMKAYEALQIMANQARLQLEATKKNGELLEQILQALEGIRNDLAFPLQRFVDSRA